MRSDNIRINVLSSQNKSFVTINVENLDLPLPRFPQREEYRAEVRMNVEVAFFSENHSYILEPLVLLMISEEDDFIISNGEEVSRSSILYPYPTMNVER